MSDASNEATSPQPLADGQVAHFRKSGWVAVAKFFSAAEARSISNWTDEILASPEAAGRHMVYREPSLLDPSTNVTQRIENFCPFHSGFDSLVRSGAIVSAVEQLLGGGANLFKDKINFKMPGGAGFEPHQDQQAGWSAYAPLFITALVSIDRSTIANGCLEVAKLPRLRALIGQEWRPLMPEEMSTFSLTPVPTEPGDVIFFDSYVPHGSKPNLSGDMRRILYLTYNDRLRGDHRARYFAEKRASFPPDIERIPGTEYKFRV